MTDLIIYSEDVSDVNTNVYRVNVIGKRQVKLVVVREHTEIPVGDSPIVLPTHQVWVGLSANNSLRMSRHHFLYFIIFFVFFFNWHVSMWSLTFRITRRANNFLVISLNQSENRAKGADWVLANQREGFLKILTWEINGPAIPGVIWKYDLFFLQQFLNYFLTKNTKIFVQILFSEKKNAFISKCN